MSKTHGPFLGQDGQASVSPILDPAITEILDGNILRDEWILRGYENRNSYPIGSMYGIYANIWGMLMVNVTIYGIHGSYGI